MKSNCLLVLFTFFLLSASTFAQEAPSEEEAALSAWLKSEAIEQAQNAVNAELRGESVKAGNVRILTLDEHPAPDAVKKNIARGVENRQGQVQTVGPERIATISSVLESTSKVRRTNAELASRLTFSPSNLSRTPLANAELISTDPTGTRQGNGLASGLSRLFRMPGIGVIELNEDDYVSGKTQITLVKESLNTEVNGNPAVEYSAKSTDGRGQAVLLWVTPRRSYHLALLTDNSDTLPQAKKILMDTATHIIE